jgi:hypothetical protein
MLKDLMRIMNLNPTGNLRELRVRSHVSNA